MTETDRNRPHPQTLPGARTPRASALRIALIYAAIGAAWILFSDVAVNALFSHEFTHHWHLQTVKGWFYIAVTSAFLYMLIRRTFTAVRASAEAQRQIEQRTKLLVERVRDYAIFTVDLEGRVTSWNRGAMQITGFQEADILGRNFAVFYTNSDVEAGRPKQHLAEATDLGWSEEEALRLRKDGTKFRAAVQLTALRDDDDNTAGGGSPATAGRVTGFLCVLRDVTERHRIQEALQRVAQTLTGVIDASPLPIITLDAATNVMGWNAAAETMFGWAADEVIGKPLPTIPDSEREEFRQMLSEQSGSGEGIAGRELIRRRKDGSLIELSIWTAPLRDSGGNISGVIGIFADLSDRKRAEVTVRQLNETLERRVGERTARLEEANEELQAFSYTVSHDLRIPLRSLQQLARDLMDTQGGRLDDEGRANAMRIVGAAARMERQIEELLEYSRVSRSELKTEPVSLILIVHELIGRLERDPSFRDAQVSVQEPLGWVMAHRLTLQQVILNLLTNALTFVCPGTRAVVNIRAYDHENGALRLRIEDNGIGISNADRERVFHIFERLPAAESYPGIGVGLTVARRGVERMGGRISFEPAASGGTVFYLDLPKAQKS